MSSKEWVNHPEHYGAADDPYEAIKVIDAWQLGFSLGNAVKYLARAGKKGNAVEDLRKAVWYIQHEIGRLNREQAHAALVASGRIVAQTNPDSPPQ